MKQLRLVGLLAVLAGEISAFALPGQMDGAYANLNLQFAPNSLLALPDGRVVVGFGNQSPVFNGTNVGAVLQLNPDGTLDGSFAASDTNKYTIYGVTRLTGGDLLVDGSFTNWVGTRRKTLVKLNSTGAVQTGFFSGVTGTAKIYVGEQPDGKIILASSSTSLTATNGNTLPPVARLLADGTRDTNFFTTNTVFACYGFDLVPDGSGRYFLGYLNLSTIKYDLARFNADGTYDTNFAVVSFENSMAAVHALVNGGAVVGGAFTTYTNRFGLATVPHLVRINPDGSRDSSFNFTDGRSPTTFALQADGKVILPNTTTTPFTGEDRFNVDGSLDGSWTHNSTAWSGAPLLTIDGSDRVLRTGPFSINVVYRIQNDSSFGPIPPFFTSAPGNANVYPGDSANFILNASGPGPFAYQWQFNSNNIPGATNTALTVSNCQQTNAGLYRLLASNTNGSTFSTNAQLTLRQDPHIVQNPLPISADASDTTNFSVAYASLSPVTFQWLFNNVAIAGGTNNPYVLSPVYTTNAGNYSVIISNVYGAATSSPALLSVNSTLRFKSQPITNFFAPLGAATNLSAVAAGNPPLNFQWYMNGAPVTGANSSSFTFNPFDRTNSGNYALVVTNNSGSITSLVAKVTFPFATPQSAWVISNALPFGTVVRDLKSDGALGVVLGGNSGVSRVDDDGSLRWFVPFLPATNIVTSSGGLACAVDGQGNTFVATEFKGIVSVGGLSATNPGTSSPGGHGTLLAKLDITGQAQWLRYIDGALNDTKLAADGGGGVVISGGHTGLLTFGSASAQPNSYGVSSGVITRYATDGTRSWIRDYPDYISNRSVEIDAVVAQGTNIWVGGIFTGTIKFGSLTPIASSMVQTYYWLGCLNTNGTELWVQTIPNGAQGLQLGVGMDQSLWAANGNAGGIKVRYSTNGVALAYTSGDSGSIGCVNVDSNNVGVASGVFSHTAFIGTNYFDQPGTLTNNCYTARFNTNCVGVGAVVDSYATNYPFQLFSGNRRGDVYVAGIPPVRFANTNVTGTNFFVAKLNAPGLAPTIVTQPNPNSTNPSLTAFLIGVTVQGQSPVNYQWRSNGIPVPNQTNANLVLYSPLPADGGSFDCVVSNLWGTATTSPSLVTFTPPFSILQQPGSTEIVLGTNTIGGSNILASFLQPATMIGHTFNFFITNGSGMWPMTANFTFKLTSVSAYSIPSGTLGNHSGSWGNQVTYPNGVGFSLYYWSTSPSNIMSSINLFVDGSFDIHHDISDPAGCCANGYYTIGASANSNAYFTVSATGSVLPAYQWYRNGVLLPGQTNANLNFTPAGYPQSGTYTATLSYGSYTTTTAPATLNIYPPAIGYTFVPGNSTLDFTIPPGYILQSTTSLAPPSWTTISTNSTFTVPMNQAGAYFRIVP